MRITVKLIIVFSLFLPALLWAASGDKNDDVDQFRPIPQYPRQAVMDCTQGRVVAEFSISAEFEPVDVKIHDSEPAGVFDEAVMAALDRWVVNAAPGTRMKEVFEFNLDGCPEPGLRLNQS